MRVPESGTQEENMEKQESLEMFMLKRKILKELEEMDENEDFIMQIGLAGKEKMSDTVYVLDQVGIRLVKEKTLISDTQLKRPEQVVGFVSDILREYDREVMCVICLNAKLNPVNMCICSMGAVDKAIASPREIMKTAILSNANGFIILHNHPGGSSQPSLEDIHVTDVMSKAGELLGIPLYDHIIAAAGSDEIYSFYEKGSMPQSQLKYADRVADINLRSDMAETNEIRKPLKLHQIKI